MIAFNYDNFIKLVKENEELRKPKPETAPKQAAKPKKKLFKGKK